MSASPSLESEKDDISSGLIAASAIMPAPESPNLADWITAGATVATVLLAIGGGLAAWFTGRQKHAANHHARVRIIVHQPDTRGTSRAWLRFYTRDFNLPLTARITDTEGRLFDMMNAPKRNDGGVVSAVDPSDPALWKTTVETRMRREAVEGYYEGEFVCRLPVGQPSRLTVEVFQAGEKRIYRHRTDTAPQ